MSDDLVYRKLLAESGDTEFDFRKRECLEIILYSCSWPTSCLVESFMHLTREFMKKQHYAQYQRFYKRVILVRWTGR